jgi:flagellar basal body-associated protein FliL
MARIIIFLLIVIAIFGGLFLLSKFGNKLLNQRRKAKDRLLEENNKEKAFNRCKELLVLITYDDDTAYLVKESLVKYFNSKDTKMLEKKRVEIFAAYGEPDEVGSQNVIGNGNVQVGRNLSASYVRK